MATSTLVSAAPAALTSTCVGCLFGATASTLLSYTQQVIETIEVSIQPYVTILPDGSQSTSYSSSTFTLEIVPTSGSNASAPSTYAHPSEITWSHGDQTLTYGTTYVQYLGFAGAAPTPNAGQLCAQAADVTGIILPTSTESASYLYPLAPNATAGITLPSLLLEYLGSLPEVSSQLGGEPLTSCAPLPSVPTSILRRAQPSVAQSPPSTRKRFEGARTTDQQNAFELPSFAHFPTVALERREISPYSGGNGTNSTIPAGNLTSTSAASIASSSESFASSSAASSSAVNGGGSTLSTILNSHTTGYLITTITGKPIVTGSPAPVSPAPDVTNPTDASPPPYSPTQGNEGGATGGPGNGSPTGGSDGTGGGGSQQTGGSGQHTNAPNKVESTPASDNSPAPTVDTSPEGSNVISNLIPYLGGAGGSSTQGTNNGGEAGGNVFTNLRSDLSSIAAGQTEGAGSDGTAPPVFTIGSSTLSPDSDGQYVYGSQTLKPGTTLTAGSGNAYTAVVLQTSGGSTRLVVGGHTQSAIAAGVGATSTVITTNGHTFIAIQSGGSVILQDASSTVTLPAGSAATFEGQTISAASSGGAVLVNGQAVTSLGQATATGPAEAVITANGHTITAIHSSGFIVLEDGTSSKILEDGATVTFDGQTVAAASDGSSVVIGGSSTVKLSATHVPSVSSTGLGDYVASGLGTGSPAAGSTVNVATEPSSTNTGSREAGLSLALPVGVALFVWLISS